MIKPSSGNSYKLMQRFADITKAFIIQGNIRRVEKCLRIANALFVYGNNSMKNAVSNVYLYSISFLLDQRNEQSLQVMSVLPFELRKEYEHQVNGTGV